MSLGPVFRCPHNLDARIPQLARSIGIRVEALDGPGPQYIFRSGFGRIVGHRSRRENFSTIWLVFPKIHAFIPLLWVADFRLSARIEKLLQEGGASRCEWDF